MQESGPITTMDSQKDERLKVGAGSLSVKKKKGIIKSLLKNRDGKGGVAGYGAAPVTPSILSASMPSSPAISQGSGSAPISAPSAPISAPASGTASLAKGMPTNSVGRVRSTKGLKMPKGFKKSSLKSLLSSSRPKRVTSRSSLFKSPF